jgi:hypothetical protein
MPREEFDMPSAKSKTPEIPLPGQWNETVKSAILQVLARTRSWASNIANSRIRLKAETVVRRLKTLSPWLGKVKIAAI